MYIVHMPANSTHTFGIGVFFELLLQSLQWERTQLLHSNECCVLVGCWCLPLFQKGIVMLPWAQHHLLDTAWNKNNNGLGLLHGFYFEGYLRCPMEKVLVLENLCVNTAIMTVCTIKDNHTFFHKWCDLCTFLLRLKCHPTLVWKMFLVPVQPDWKLPPRKRAHII